METDKESPRIRSFEDLQILIDQKIRDHRKQRVSTNKEHLIVQSLCSVEALQDLRVEIFGEELPIERTDVLSLTSR